MFLSKEHEKVAEYAKKFSYDVCTDEMCEEGDKIDFPKINLDTKSPRPMYDEKTNSLIINPNFRYGIEALLRFGSEMPHHFHYHLSNGSYSVEHILRDLLYDKETKVKLRWEEGVSFRVLERMLLKYIKDPSGFEIEGKISLPPFPPEVCIHRVLKERNALFDVAKETSEYYGHSDLIAFLRKEDVYKENSYIGWKVVREIPKDEFKRLLKDGEAHKKIPGIQIKSLSQRIAERLKLRI